MGHEYCKRCAGDCAADHKTQPDVTCKLCFLPEGYSPFERVGKRKVQHQSCAGAWAPEDAAKGREHVLMLQIEKVEADMANEPVPAGETVAAAALPQEYIDFKKSQLGAADGQAQAAS